MQGRPAVSAVRVAAAPRTAEGHLQSLAVLILLPPKGFSPEQFLPRVKDPVAGDRVGAAVSLLGGFSHLELSSCCSASAAQLCFLCPWQRSLGARQEVALCLTVASSLSSRGQRACLVPAAGGSSSPAGTCLHPAASEVTALALWVPRLVCSGAVPASGRSSSDCQSHRGTWRGAHPLQGKLCCQSHGVKWWLQSWGNSRRRKA